jgi:hypothetical protein
MVDDLPFTSPTPGEFLWALEKDVKWVVCELHDYGADGIEVRLAHNDQFSASRRFAARAQALAHADAIRKLLQGAGWSVVTATA